MVVDRVVSCLVVAAPTLVGAALLCTVVVTLAKGLPALIHPNFYTSDMAGVRPSDPFDRGGIFHAIVGTLIEVAIAVAIALPLGVITAVYMSEVGGRGARIVRTVVEAMTALPSIVAGLFIYTTLIVGLGFPSSGFAAALALAVMGLPIMARASDVVLRVVPGGLREASYALGAGRWQTVWKVVLPTARPGLATALILGVARMVGETSPLHPHLGRLDLLQQQPGREPDELPSVVRLQRRRVRRAQLRAAGVRRRDGAPRHRAGALRPRPARRPQEDPPMRLPTRFSRPAAALAAIGLALLVPAAAVPAADAAATHALIQGSGSSWAANAINQWVADVANQGMKVVFTANGAAQGRKDYANRSTDFGVSDIPYRGADPTTGQEDSPRGRSFAYLPVAAGGTSFPYHIEVAGKLVRNVRLSGETIAKIFTSQITNWNDPEITKDNNGKALPSIPIIPVVHSEGAGVTTQFTRYLDQAVPVDLGTCNGGKVAETEYFPLNCGKSSGNQKAQAGSDGVMNFIKSKGANGSIGIEEYSYPLLAGYPAIKLLNKAGYFTLPTQYNVAVALTKAVINKDPKVAGLPDPEPRPGLRERRPAHLPAVVVRLRDHPDRLRRHPDDDAEAADARGLPLLLHLPGSGRDRPDRLLLAAGQPGHRRVRPDRQAQGGRP